MRGYSSYSKLTLQSAVTALQLQACQYHEENSKHNYYQPPSHKLQRGRGECELYFLIKSLINIERTIDLRVTDDKVLPTDERLQNGHKQLN